MIKINKSKTASFDVDAQKTFTPLCPAELPVPGGDLIGAELNAQARFTTLRVGSKDAHSPQAIWVADEKNPVMSFIMGEDVDVRWPVHAVPGTKGFELLDDLPQPRDYDFFVWKGIEVDMHPYGSCYHDHAEKLSTGVIEFLRVKDIDTVIVGGLALDYCVKTTALQLARAGFSVIVNLAATRSIAQETMETAIQEMQAHGIKLIDSSEHLTEA
jgi:nicotinamidase/pyrazinamidase